MLGSLYLLIVRLKLSVPLYSNHLKKWRTESRDWEQNTPKSERLVVEISTTCAFVSNLPNWACAFVSNLPNNDSDWSVSKYSVKHVRHAGPCTATHCTALGESPTHWSVIPLMFMYVHTSRTVCLSVLVFEHPCRGRVKIRGLLWNLNCNPPTCMKQKSHTH